MSLSTRGSDARAEGCGRDALSERVRGTSRARPGEAFPRPVHVTSLLVHIGQSKKGSQHRERWGTVRVVMCAPRASDRRLIGVALSARGCVGRVCAPFAADDSALFFAARVIEHTSIFPLVSGVLQCDDVRPDRNGQR